jgi:hypothetical protein
MANSKLEASYKALHQKIWVDQDDTIFEDKQARARYAKVEGILEGVMMIRSEYLKLWDFVQKDHAHLASNPAEQIPGGLVVTGQPGIDKSAQASFLNVTYTDAIIGKTLFLKYALLQALKARIPVTYCDKPDRLYIFNEDGCNMYLRSEFYDLPQGGLCLVDSNDELIQLPAKFLDPFYYNYVVQATSPEPDRWRQWAKEQGAQNWIMPLWTRDEMAKLV